MRGRRGAGLLVLALAVSGLTAGCGGGRPHSNVVLGPQSSSDPTTTTSRGQFELPSLPSVTTTTTIAVVVPPGTPLPNPRLTPGVVDHKFSMTDVCSRNVPPDPMSNTIRAQVMDRYGIVIADRHKYVVDHLVPRSLGGSADLANLWPIPTSSSWSKDKSRLETELLYRVCAIQLLTLADAQQQVVANWYVTFVRDLAPPLNRG